MTHQENNNEQPQGLSPVEKVTKIIEAINDYINTHEEELEINPEKKAKLKSLLNKAGSLVGVANEEDAQKLK